MGGLGALPAHDEPVVGQHRERGHDADLVLLARAMLRDPYWPYHAALKLGDERAASILPPQYARAVRRR